MFNDLMTAKIEDISIQKIIFDHHFIAKAYDNCFGCELFLSYPSDDTFVLSTDQLREFLMERGDVFAAKFLSKAKEFIDEYVKTVAVPIIYPDVVKDEIEELRQEITRGKDNIASLEAKITELEGVLNRLEAKND